MRTLILVVHGIGSQRAWETLATIAAGLSSHARVLGQAHMLQPRLERVLGGVEGIVRVAFDDPARMPIDVREFHWQGMVAGRASARAVAAWLLRNGVAALRVQRTWRVSRPHGRAHALRAVARQYLQALLLLALTAAGSTVGLHALLGTSRLFVAAVAGDSLPPSTMLVVALAWLLLFAAASFMRSHVGDVALYLSEHPASPWHATRVAVHTALARQLQEAIAQPDIARVVLVGHSLGSVIALDALDTLARIEHGNPRLQRVHALLTLASPLDQVAALSHGFDHVHNSARVHASARLEAQLHAFWWATRHRCNTPNTDGLTTARADAYAHLQWVNIYTPSDVLADPLLHYPVQARIPLRQWHPWGAHARPWRDPITFAVLHALACGRDAQASAAGLCSARETTPRSSRERDWRWHGRQRRSVGGGADGCASRPVRTEAEPHHTRPPQRQVR